MYETRKCGPHRLQFTIEGVLCLRKNLEAIGSSLLIAKEKPEEFIGRLME